MSDVDFSKFDFEIENTDKAFFPKDKITKGDVLEYYYRIADWMLPYLKDRPLSLHRFPDGIAGKDFFQKEIPDYFPDWIERKKIKNKEGGSQDQVVCQNTKSLIYLVNQATLVFHSWTSTVDSLNRPDQLVWDLDPSQEDFSQIIKTAKRLREILEEIELVCFVMTTGSRGLHVVVPIKPEKDFGKIRPFCKQVSQILVDRYSETLTLQPRKNKRQGKIFMDYLRNSYAQTHVVPYSLRARAGAPVATPLDWKELQGSEIGPQSFHMKNILKRMSQKENPWKGMKKNARSLSGPLEKLKKIKSD